MTQSTLTPAESYMDVMICTDLSFNCRVCLRDMSITLQISGSFPSKSLLFMAHYNIFFEGNLMLGSLRSFHVKQVNLITNSVQSQVEVKSWLDVLVTSYMHGWCISPLSQTFITVYAYGVKCRSWNCVVTYHIEAMPKHQNQWERSGVPYNFALKWN